MVRKFATEHRTSFWQRFCLCRFFRARFWRFSFRSSFFDLTRCLEAFVSSHKHKWERYQISISISTNNKHLPTYLYLYVKTMENPTNSDYQTHLQIYSAKTSWKSSTLGTLAGATSCPVTKQVLIWGNHIHPFSGDWRGMVGWCVSWNGDIAIVSMSFRRWIMPWKLVWEQNHFCTTAGKCNKWKRLAAHTLKLRYRWIRSQIHKLWPFKPSWNYWN